MTVSFGATAPASMWNAQLSPPRGPLRQASILFLDMTQSTEAAPRVVGPTNTTEITQ